MKYLGQRKTEAFLKNQTNALSADGRGLWVRIQGVDRKGTLLFSSFVENPYWLETTTKGYFAYNCSTDIFVDVPAKIDLTKLTVVRAEDADNTRKLYFETVISDVSKDLDPQQLLEARRVLDPNKARVLPLVKNGDATNSYDLVILGDGFSEKEAPVSSDEALRSSAYGQKALKLAEGLLKEEPYFSLKEHVNVWLVATPSNESGISFEKNNMRKDTFFGTTFGTDCIDRALSVRNQMLALEAASLTPFDQIVMVANSELHGGTGGTIITTSLEGGGLPILIHELGHSLGLLADTYHYFSDGEESGTCADRKRGSMVYTRRNTRGANAMGTKDEDLAPNLTVSSDVTKAKWSHLLMTDSPVVSFTFPQGEAVHDSKAKTLTYKYTLERDEFRLLLLAGQKIKTNRAIFKFTSATVNGVVHKREEFETITKVLDKDRFGGDEGLDFLSLGSFSGHVGDTLTIALDYTDSDAADKAWRWASDANSLTIPSSIFDPNRTGLFQGANPDLKKVWRSSYLSRMAGDVGFDANELEAMRRAIQEYTR